MNERKAKKTLMHAMRQALFAKQLLKTHGDKFLDFTEGNDFYRQFVDQFEADGKNSKEKWENTKKYFEEHFDQMYESIQKEINVYEEYNKWEGQDLVVRYLSKEEKTREELRRELSVSCVEKKLTKATNNEINEKRNENGCFLLELHAEKYYSSSQSNINKECRCSALVVENGEYRFACLPFPNELSYIHINQRMYSTIAEWKKKELPKINEKALESIKWGEGDLKCYIKPNSIVVGLFYLHETKSWEIVGYVESAYAYSYVRRFDVPCVSKEEEIYERHKFITFLIKDKFWVDWKESGYLLPEDNKNVCFHFFYHPDLKKIEYYLAQNVDSRTEINFDFEKYKWCSIPLLTTLEAKMPSSEVLSTLYKELLNICPLYSEGILIVDKYNNRISIKQELYDNIEDLVCPHITFQLQIKRNILLALCIDLSDKEKDDFNTYFPLINASFNDVLDNFYIPYVNSMQSTFEKMKDLDDPHQINSVIPKRTGFKILFKLKKYGFDHIKPFLKNMNNPNIRKNLIELVINFISYSK
eukprot:TRINITY_DN7589_c0_g1_i1.p1 TRINITY_DN7589_c0_g1~~TRINITY_DN7589_c0_g1_i1.p1  ORF type:complete len:530 (-),score=134.40 TRINITY_DN7589_c0_g1_i1:63-1652(-)